MLLLLLLVVQLAVAGGSQEAPLADVEAYGEHRRAEQNEDEHDERQHKVVGRHADLVARQVDPGELARLGRVAQLAQQLGLASLGLGPLLLQGEGQVAGRDHLDDPVDAHRLGEWFCRHAA